MAIAIFDKKVKSKNPIENIITAVLISVMDGVYIYICPKTSGVNAGIIRAIPFSTYTLA